MGQPARLEQQVRKVRLVPLDQLGLRDQPVQRALKDQLGLLVPPA